MKNKKEERHMGKRILLENCPGLGDLIMLTPSLRKIKELYPDCILTVMSYTHNLPMIDRLPYVDAVCGLDKNKRFFRLKTLPVIAKQDIIIFTSWQPQLALMAAISGVKQRYGICRPKYEHSPLFTKCLAEDDGKQPLLKAKIFAQQISSALDVNLSIDLGCEVSSIAMDEAKSLKEKLLSNNISPSEKYIVVSPFGKSSKSIPEHLLLETLNYVLAKYDYNCIFSDSQKQPIFAKLCHQLKGKRVYDLSEQLTLRELVALLAGAKLLLATNSGPMHIACAKKVPTVAMFANSTPYRWAPWKYCYPVFVGVPCSPCPKDTALNCPHPKCITKLNAQMFISAIDEALKGKSSS